MHYDNAIAAAQRSAGSDNATTRSRAQKFLIERVCSVCHGTRLNPTALSSQLDGRNLAQISALDLGQLRRFVEHLPALLPREVARVTKGLTSELFQVLEPLLDLGLAYLQLDRAGATLSTGERQRIELTSTVRANTTGMLYVLDEPSVGLHPSNVEGLITTVQALVRNGNSVVVVEHDVDVVRRADWVLELGPGAGRLGGRIVAQGTVDDVRDDPRSVIGPYLAGRPAVHRTLRRPDGPRLEIEVGDLWNLHNVTAGFPVGCLTGAAGPSGAGKTGLVVDSLLPASNSPADRCRPMSGDLI